MLISIVTVEEKLEVYNQTYEMESLFLCVFVSTVHAQS
jgi:hypothetical protein